MLAGYEEYAAANPEDPDSQCFMDAGARREYNAFLATIRQTTGFGYGLFRVTAHGSP